MDYASMLINHIGGMVQDRANSPEKQMEMSNQLMDKQFLMNNASMNKSFDLQMKMYDKTGYQARVEQMKKAGLNPALIYGTGASGGGGTTGNNNAISVNQPNAPQLSNFKANAIAAQGMALQNAKLQSEINLNNSIASSNNANAAKTSGIDTKLSEQNLSNLSQSLKSEEARTASINLDNDLKEIEKIIAEKSIKNNISKIGYLAQEAMYNAFKSNAEWKEAVANSKVAAGTVQDRIEQVSLKNRELASEILVNSSQNKINIEKAKQIISEIEQNWGKLKNETERVEQGWRALEVEITKTLMNNGAAMSREELRSFTQILITLMSVGANTAVRSAPNESYSESHNYTSKE